MLSVKGRGAQARGSIHKKNNKKKTQKTNFLSREDQDLALTFILFVRRRVGEVAGGPTAAAPDVPVAAAAAVLLLVSTISLSFSLSLLISLLFRALSTRDFGSVERGERRDGVWKEKKERCDRNGEKERERRTRGVISICAACCKTSSPV
jgi:hypothetical protein